MPNFNAHIIVESDGLDRRDFANANQYISDVMRILYQIAHTRTGSAVTQAMAMGRKNLYIRPYNAADKRDDTYNAYAYADDPYKGTRKGGHWTDTTGRRHHGDGGGSTSIIHFSSSTWAAYEHQFGHHSGASPDEILLHEMVHALRQMVGMAEQVRLGHLYDDEEEFFAIVVANIFVSETGRLADLRSDHHGFNPLSQNQDTSEEFLPKADLNDYRYRLIQKMVRQEQFLCLRLAEVPGPFNPIRRYFDLQTPAVQRAASSQPPIPLGPAQSASLDGLPDKTGHSHPVNNGLFGRFGPGHRLGFYA